MTSYDDIYGSKYLSATDLEAPVTVTITEVATEIFQRPNAPSQTKAILHFKGAKKGMVVNRTNADALARAFGKTFENWINKRITIRPEQTLFSGKPTMGLRLYPAANGSDRITSGPIVPPEPPPRNDMDDEIPF